MFTVRRRLISAAACLFIVFTLAATAALAISPYNTTRISVAADGSQGNGISADVAISLDGRHAVFGSAANNLTPQDTHPGPDVFVKNLRMGGIQVANMAYEGTIGNSGAGDAAISGNGKVVVFIS